VTARNDDDDGLSNGMIVAIAAMSALLALLCCFFCYIFYRYKYGDDDDSEDDGDDSNRASDLDSLERGSKKRLLDDDHFHDEPIASVNKSSRSNSTDDDDDDRSSGSSHSEELNSGSARMFQKNDLSVINEVSNEETDNDESDHNPKKKGVDAFEDEYQQRDGALGPMMYEASDDENDDYRSHDRALSSNNDDDDDDNAYSWGANDSDETRSTHSDTNTDQRRNSSEPQGDKFTDEPTYDDGDDGNNTKRRDGPQDPSERILSGLKDAVGEAPPTPSQSSDQDSELKNEGTYQDPDGDGFVKVEHVVDGDGDGDDSGSNAPSGVPDKNAGPSQAQDSSSKFDEAPHQPLRPKSEVFDLDSDDSGGGARQPEDGTARAAPMATNGSIDDPNVAVGIPLGSDPKSAPNENPDEAEAEADAAAFDSLAAAVKNLQEKVAASPNVAERSIPTRPAAGQDRSNDGKAVASPDEDLAEEIRGTMDKSSSANNNPSGVATPPSDGGGDDASTVREEIDALAQMIGSNQREFVRQRLAESKQSDANPESDNQSSNFTKAPLAARVKAWENKIDSVSKEIAEKESNSPMASPLPRSYIPQSKLPRPASTVTSPRPQLPPRNDVPDKPEKLNSQLDSLTKKVQALSEIVDSEHQRSKQPSSPAPTMT